MNRKREGGRGWPGGAWGRCCTVLERCCCTLAMYLQYVLLFEKKEIKEKENMSSREKKLQMIKTIKGQRGVQYSENTDKIKRGQTTKSNARTSSETAISVVNRAEQRESSACECICECV